MIKFPKWLLLLLMVSTICIFSYHLSTLIFDGIPTTKSEKITLVMNLISTGPVAIVLFIQWRGGGRKSN